MSSYVLAVSLLASTLLGSMAQAQDDPDRIAALAGPGLVVAQNLPGASNNNPYNNPIRRANPNSMQGTRPAAPVIRAPNTVPVPRPPTLDNGGIGNGYPRPNATPGTVRPYVSPAPPPRDPDTSNR
jgi:hypothetical protein